MPYEKIGKNEPVCIADEVPFEIPESWEWCRVGDLFSNMTGLSYKKEQLLTKSDNMVRVLRGGNIDNESYNLKNDDVFISAEYVKSALLLKKNYMITPAVSSLEHIGKIALVECDYENVVVGGFVLMLVPHLSNDVLSKYLLYAFATKTHRDNCRNITHKSGQAFYNISREKLMNLPIPLPPVSEQNRIVKKVEELLPDIKKYNELDQISEALNSSFPEQLKKSILQYAVQGKLVPQDPTDESASALLERIRAEKEHLIKSGKIKRDKHESLIFRRDNSYYERVDGIERCIDDEIPFEISDSWEWCRLGELIETIDTGKSFKCEERPPDKNEYGIIKVSAVTWGTFNQEESKTCFSTSPWVKGYSIQVDDFLICRANTAALVGGCVIVDKISKSLMLSDKVLRIEFSDSISKTYVLYTLRTPFVRAQLSAAASGTSESMKNISQNAIKGLLIPFPPIKEQYRIVSKVEESLSKIKTL